MKILQVATLMDTLNAFMTPYIGMLHNEGNVIDVAGFIDPTKDLKEEFKSSTNKMHNIPFSRSPLNYSNIKAYRALKRVICKGHYDIVQCHTPIASVITRMLCMNQRKKGLKVIYTAHGFHFFKGAPLKNWLIFYPVEWLCSWWTDVLITINKEDYKRAKNHFHAKKTLYIPGVGVDLSKYSDIKVSRFQKRKELGIPENAFVLLSVGELNENKNQQIIIKALANLNNSNIHYLIAGKGNMEEALRLLARKLGVEKQVHLLGFRTDVPELDKISDAFCFPSRREGLGMAALEAMACGLPLITSNIHGINDYSIDGVTGYKCDRDDVNGFARTIENLVKQKENGEIEKYHHNNVKAVKRFDIRNSMRVMEKVYKELGGLA